MSRAIVFDCEFAAIEGSERRFWWGPQDPDPVAVQIGAVCLGLDADFDISDTFSCFIQPVDRRGQRQDIDPFLTDLAGISPTDVLRDGLPLITALEEFDRFSGGANFWSWGKDELNLIGISCYASGVTAPIPATRFGNACSLRLAAGMAYDDIQRTRSGRLAAFFGLEYERIRDHDALDDAWSVAVTLQTLLRQGKLTARDFRLPG